MRTAIIFSIAILASSCVLVKNVAKHKDKTRTETDSTATSHVNTETTEKQQTVRVTTLEADTSASVKGTTIKGSISVRDLADHPLVLDNGTQQVTVKLDKDGIIKAIGKTKDQVVPLKFRKRIEEKILSDRNIKTKAETKVTETATTISKTSTTDKQVRRWGLPWYYGVMIILALLVAVYLTLRKRLRFLP